MIAQGFEILFSQKHRREGLRFPDIFSFHRQRMNGMPKLSRNKKIGAFE
jgi:hypothetical protein